MLACFDRQPPLECILLVLTKGCVVREASDVNFYVSVPQGLSQSYLWWLLPNGNTIRWSLAHDRVCKLRILGLSLFLHPGETNLIHVYKLGRLPTVTFLTPTLGRTDGLILLCKKATTEELGVMFFADFGGRFGMAIDSLL